MQPFPFLKIHIPLLLRRQYGSTTRYACLLMLPSCHPRKIIVDTQDDTTIAEFPSTFVKGIYQGRGEA